MRVILRWALGVVLGGLMLANARGQGCDEGWSNEFGLKGLFNEVRAMGMFDLGNGPHPYAGGWFYWPGKNPVGYVAQWDGLEWQPVGTGIGGTLGKTVVYTLAAFDDGSGPALYAGGWFTTADGKPALNVARWDGEQWSAMGEGISSTVRALAVFDDGSGPALYAAGLTEPDGGLWKWDGARWQVVNGGLQPGSESLGGYCLRVFDDGSGPALYVGGNFDWVGDGAAHNIARWDGHSWSAVGHGLGGGHYYDTVISMTVHDDGSGMALYASGDFEKSGDTTVHSVARWTGTEWEAVGKPEELPNEWAPSIASGPAGNGEALFTTIHGKGLSAVYQWTGSQWSSIGDTYEIVRVMATMDLGSGPRLWAGGNISMIGDACTRNLASWDGGRWISESDWGGAGAQDLLAVPAGPAAGLYEASGGCWANSSLARWDGERWGPVGLADRDATSTLAVFDNGSGPAVYANGNIGHDSTRVAYRIDHDNFVAVGDPFRYALTDCLAVADIGAGPALYASGYFLMSDGAAWSVLRLADGQWAPTARMTRLGKATRVGALIEYDDGGGPRLYAAGEFDRVGPVIAHGLAAWDGAEWTAPGGLGSEPRVQSMAVFDDGSGPGLYVAGQFEHAGGHAAGNIARWSGGQWRTLLGGTDAPILDLAAGTANGRPLLVAGGEFALAGGLLAKGIAAWDGSSWLTLKGGVRGIVRAVAFPGPEFGGGVLISGEFGETTDGRSSQGMARYNFCPAPCPADCDLSGSLDLLDYLCFSALFNAADPGADCDGNGSLDLFDFLCFVNAFNAGCPG